MVLIHNIKNEDAIGKEVVPDIGLNKPWVRYTDDEGINGTEPVIEDYYRDVYCPNSGVLLYSLGEVCIIVDYDEKKNTVTLKNENIGMEFSNVFTISYTQYAEDFFRSLNTK